VISDEDLRASSARMAALDELDRRAIEEKRDAEHAEAKRLGAFNPQNGIDYAASGMSGYRWIATRGD
jgi:hypothetical protein